MQMIMELPHLMYQTAMVFVEIAAIEAGVLWIILRYDRQHGLTMNARWKGIITAWTIMASLWIAGGLSGWNAEGRLACGILAAYLLLAALTDMQTCQVYDFLHLIGAVGGLWAMWIMQPDISCLVSLILFWLLQRMLFMRMYGEADGMAFLVCALYESCSGTGLLTYLLHMAAAFLLLAVVQGFRHNINEKGNLKQPVPFVPYIIWTVWGFL